MTLKNQLNDDLKDAMRNGEVTRRATIRLMLSALRNEEIAQQKELGEDDVLQVINKQAQQRRESIEAYKSAKREDLVDKEQAELDIIVLYLPEPLSETEVMQIIEETITELGASGPQDMGKVMGKIISQTRGRADGKEISSKVAELLQNIG
ncbi:MAG: aspartyl-tRNA amidotransferase [Dehalococcoidia bacterium]|nr:aspartyl-tRNA amidotransferase [Dehalococcoidia bacterium]MQG15562.1 GatB/YqeY domain-containing protein [SAR202 cluster bacterium]|tara:strand:- start:35385 stop:35837 length:453 start_codon:yes stop_codon:yes gene_type:complete